MKVYLYELDSVRNTAAEIELAQKRLFEETVGNGNTVVLSANQIVDGEGLIYGLYGDDGDKNYETILTMFQTGMIKVCKFTDKNTGKRIDSLVEYRMLNMERDQFKFSGVGTDPDMRKHMKDAYENGAIYKLDKWVEEKKDETEKKNAEYVRRVIRLIYELGMYDIWEEEDKTIKVTFECMMNYILHPESMGKETQKKYDETKTACPEIQRAVDLLSELDKTIPSDKRNERSPWRDPTDEYNPVGVKLYQNADAEVKAIAQIIIDLCYNIAVESGIKNISVSYETYERTGKGEEIKKIRENQCVRFLEEFKTRLEQTTPQEKEREQIEFPPWGDALEVIQEAKLADKGKAEDEVPFPPPLKWYGTISAQKKTWNKKFSELFWKRIRYLGKCAIILAVLGIFIDVLEGFIDFLKELLQQNITITGANGVGLYAGSAFIILIILLNYPLRYLSTYICDWFVHAKIVHSGEDTVETLKRMVTLFLKRRSIKKYLEDNHTNDEKGR
ncbi:MAG: hypothetical protein LUC87_07725 [Clostridiales bacterium]|nr:hypothetical protein [Clostridiales bacterium]